MTWIIYVFPYCMKRRQGCFLSIKGADLLPGCKREHCIYRIDESDIEREKIDEK